MLALVFAPASASAQRSGINVSGDFAFYVLSLSWSPSYCQAEGASADRMQCAGGRPYSFIVHGLWPQYERGWPEYCPVRPSRAPDVLVREMLDIMPSPGLVRHQWEKHGACAGLSPEGYFETLRRARGAVRVPAAFASVRQRVMVSPDAVADAFRTENPAIPADGIAVTCDRQRLREVRICMDRDLSFRSCPEVARRDCALTSVSLPPVR